MLLPVIRQLWAVSLCVLLAGPVVAQKAPPAPIRVGTVTKARAAQHRFRHLLMPRTRFARTEYPGYVEFRRKISAADKAQVVLVKTKS